MLVVGAFFGGMVAQRALLDHQRQAVRRHEKAVLDYQEALRDYAGHLRNPSGAVTMYFEDGWRPDPKTGLPLPPPLVEDLATEEDRADDG
jgi:hypothetical protein